MAGPLIFTSAEACSEAPDGPVDGKVAELLGLAIIGGERLAIDT
jgi:hypothetical protein